MSNENEHSEPKQITPQELVEELLRADAQVRNYANSEGKENDWARTAIGRGIHWHIDNSDYYTEKAIAIPFDKIKELCPNLYSQVIEPAEKIVHKKSIFYKKPDQIKYLTIDAINHTRTMFYRHDYHSIGLNLAQIDKCSDINEVIAVYGHELWHTYQAVPLRTEKLFSSQKNSPKYKPIIGELDANRNSDPIGIISRYLTILAEIKDDVKRSKTYYLDGYRTENHHCYRKNIKILVEQILGDDIFGINGIFVEQKDNEYRFQPNKFSNSHHVIKKIIDEKTTGKENTDPAGYKGYVVTENGEVVTNWWKYIKPKIEKKSEEIMQVLDEMMDSGFTLDKKEEWLDLVKKEVASFKEKNQPEFMDLEKLRERGWMAKAQKNLTMSNQRG